MKRSYHFILFLISVGFLSLPLISAAESQLNFGVYAYQSKQATQQQYQPLANYFSQQLPNTKVNLKVLDGKEIIHAVRNKQVDFILTNPNLYEVIRHQVKLNGVTATQQKQYKNHHLSSLGGVIFSLASNPNIKEAKDLKYASIAIPSFNNTGAYRVPLYELHTLDITLDNQQFITVGNNDAVVQAVLDGTAEAGFVRTGILEDWIDKGLLQTQQLNIINQKPYSSFPQILSTRLYPEWPFIILPSVNEETTRLITVALFSLKESDPALLKGHLAGFTTPRDYLPFENLLRELNLYPYNETPLSLKALWTLYKLEISMSLVIVFLLLAFLFLNDIQLRKITRQKEKIDNTKALDQALLSMPKLASNHSETQLMQKTVHILENLTFSEISFIHFINDEQSAVELVTWSQNTLKKYCHIKNYDTHYSLDEAGIWAESAKTKKPFIINDYSNNELKKGLPQGHVEMQRILSIPIVDDNKVKLIAGVANKATDYTEEDINLMTLVLNELWRLIKDKRSTTIITKQKNHYQQLLDNLGNDHVVFAHSGVEGILNFVSKGVKNVFELSPEELINTPWFEKINWDETAIKTGQNGIAELAQKKQTSNSFVMSFHTPSRQHKIIYIQQNGVYKNDNLISVEGLVTDITERVQIEKDLKQAALVFDNSKEGIMITDSFNRIIRVNQRFSEITGYSAEEAMGKNPHFLSSGHQNKAFYETLWSSLLENSAWRGEIWNRRKSGEAYPQNLSITLVKDSVGKIQEFVAIMADISLEKEQERKLERMAHYDALTGLPNRFLLSDRITQAIQATIRNHSSIALLFIDLDGFKQVNDTYGHEAGDELLKTLGKRYQKAIRAGDTVSRIGGDEFIVVLTSHKNMDDITSLQDRLLNASTQEVGYKKHQLNVSSSIGVVIYSPDEHGHDFGSEQLIRYADQAMYHAKELGRNRVHTFEWGEPQNEFKLTEAIHNKELELYYQPKVDFSDNSPPAFEALIRWNHPSKGVIPPAAFLHQITTSKNQIKLANFVLHEALSFITELRQKTGKSIDISINVDSSYLLQEDVVQQIQNVFEHTFKTIEPSCLTLEILESSALGDMQQVVQAILEINKLGVKIAIDDFGTGHATLNYLKDLPVDIIKIDQAFVRNIFLQPNNVSILEAITSMAEAFEMSVIAEGVETQEHMELLLKLDINTLQGYGISKPIRSCDVLEWINNYKKSKRLINLPKLSANGKNFLKAQLYHHAWNTKIKEHILHKGLLTKTEMSHKTCPFGRWLATKSTSLITNSQLLIEIRHEHENVHSIASKAILAGKNKDQELINHYIKLLDKETRKLTTKLDQAAKITHDQNE